MISVTFQLFIIDILTKCLISTSNQRVVSRISLALMRFNRFVRTKDFIIFTKRMDKLWEILDEIRSSYNGFQYPCTCIS